MNPIRFSGVNCRLIRDTNGLKATFHISQANGYGGGVMMANTQVNLPHHGLMESLETQMENAKGKDVSPEVIQQWLTDARDYLYEYFRDLNHVAFRRFDRCQTNAWSGTPRRYDDKPLEERETFQYQCWVSAAEKYLKGNITALHRIKPETGEHEILLVPEPSAKLLDENKADVVHTFTAPPVAAVQENLRDRLALLTLLGAK